MQQALQAEQVGKGWVLSLGWTEALKQDGYLRGSVLDATPIPCLSVTITSKIHFNPNQQ